MTKKRYLEIGAGDSKLSQEWETLDRLTKPYGPDHYCCWGEQPLPLEDASIDLVYAAHVLEHVEWFQTHYALLEVHRVLKPGGVFEVWVPDFQYLVECYLGRKCGDEWRHKNTTDDPMLWLNGRIFTYGGPLGLADPNWHRTVFDFQYLSDCLTRAGFKEVVRIDKTEKPRGHNHGSISLGVRCKK